jgi:hypothetical protein
MSRSFLSRCTRFRVRRTIDKVHGATTSGLERAHRLEPLRGTSSPAAKTSPRESIDAFLTPPTVAPYLQNEKTPVDTGVLKYRYRDSNCVAYPYPQCL